MPLKTMSLINVALPLLSSINGIYDKDDIDEWVFRDICVHANYDKYDRYDRGYNIVFHL